jgi:hypothetical protein
MEQRKRSVTVDIVMHDRKPDEKLPDVAMYLISPAGAIVKKLAVAKEGKLTLQEKWKELGRVVALGPDVEELRMLRPDSLLHFRLEDIWLQWEKTEVIDVARDRWADWIFQHVCVSGNVRRCVPIIPSAVAPVLPRPPPPLQICRPVCNGVVEVYERTCCYYWAEIDDLFEDRIPWEVICEKLGPYCPKFPPEIEPGPLPDGPLPDGPLPDGPLPIDRIALRKIKLTQAQTDSATLFPPSRRLVGDMRVLKKLERKEAIEYVKARPYLISIIALSCTTRKLGEAILGPDGSFTYCYFRTKSFYRIIGRICTVTYAYKVKQWQENQWVYVYDGLVSHEYFSSDEVADLRTNLLARACETDPPPVPYPKPFVMLQDTGSTNSYHLVSPVQNSESGINTTLPANGGLVSPPPAGQNAVGKLYNRPWSETLRFRLYVHPDMQTLGAKYFRISIVAADAQGNPVAGATPKPLVDPVSWHRYVYVNGEVQVQGEGLGPHSLADSNGVIQTGLYNIPFWDATHQWLHGQFHHFWNTMLETNGRNLVILEIFNSAGDRLRPTGATGNGIDKDFDFLHWTDAINTTLVSYASLVHVFWVDKQPCYADIEDLRINGVPHQEECQFMSGASNSEFAAGFRAFHNNGPNGEPFMWFYTMWYHRGLNGPNGTIQTSGENAPPTLNMGPSAVSTPQTFEFMLNTHTKCTFALNLWVYAKHTNGSRRIHEYDRHDQAAFALEVGS